MKTSLKTQICNIHPDSVKALGMLNKFLWSNCFDNSSKGLHDVTSYVLHHPSLIKFWLLSIAPNILLIEDNTQKKSLLKIHETILGPIRNFSGNNTQAAVSCFTYENFPLSWAESNRPQSLLLTSLFAVD